VYGYRHRPGPAQRPLVTLACPVAATSPAVIVCVISVDGRRSIGGDWTVAAAVAAALVVTWLLHTAGVAAWWLPPLVAVAATGASLRRISG
jgi:hypothetical protein